MACHQINPSHRFRDVCCWRKAFSPVFPFARHKIVLVKAWETTRSDSRLWIRSLVRWKFGGKIHASIVFQVIGERFTYIFLKYKINYILIIKYQIHQIHLFNYKVVRFTRMHKKIYLYFFKIERYIFFP